MTPSFITAIESHTCAATRRSWVMNSIESPSRLADVGEQVEHLLLHRDVERRDRLVGDQHFGIRASARAMPMRWRWPPENSCG